MVDITEKKIDDFDKLELQECYSAIRAFIERRTQLVIFFGTSNIACIGAVVKLDKPGLLLLAGFTLVLFLVVDVILRVNLASYYYVASRIEYIAGREHGLVTVQMLSYLDGQKILKELKCFYLCPDPGKFRSKLRPLFTKPFGFRAKTLSIVVLLIAIVEVILGFVFWI